MSKSSTRSVDLEPIDRLEEKVKRLVDLVERLKTDHAAAVTENDRLAREIDALRTRLTVSDTLNAELAALKDERDVIRTRVGEMLDQLDAINL